MRRAAGAFALALVLVADPISATPPTATDAARAPGGSRPARGPDVLLVTIDTLRADALGFAGNPHAQTPLLDRLAATGRVFPDAHAHSVLTLPSHTTILTGLYPFQHGIRDNAGFVLGNERPTLATILRAAGWATGAFVGAFPLDSRFGLGRGFDVYDDHYRRGGHPESFQLDERRGDEVVTPALAWWKANAGKPRFLWIHLFDPHSAYDPPEPFASRLAGHPYLGEVAAVDSFLAPLLEPILAGKESPTLVVFTADHGEALGDHGEQTHGLFAYEATLHIPLVIWGPSIAASRDGRPARHVDILPTVLGFLSLPAPSGLPGRSLLAPPPEGPVDSYFEALASCLNRGWAPLRGILRDGWKYIDLPLPELYHLAVDPQEQQNLAEGERRRLHDLRRALPAESVWPPAKGAVAPEEAARLRSLGYLVDSPSRRTSFTAADDPKRLVAVDTKLQAAVEAYGLSRFDLAANLAREAIDMRPDMPHGYSYLALALRQLERPEEALAVLRKALELGLEREQLRRQLGQTLAEMGRPEEAVRALSPLRETGEPESRIALAGALSDAGQAAEAAAILDRLVKEDPRNPRVYEALGVAEMRRDRPPEARRRLEQALELNDRLPGAWNTLGVARYQLQDRAGALAAWRRAIELDARRYDTLYNLALVSAEAGDLAGAKQALRRFLDTAPPSRFAADLAKARQLLGDLEKRP